jgi:hypothetical protein
MDVHSLVDKFLELADAEVGQGPKHPTNPIPELEAPTDEFFEKYPFVCKDTGYVEFLNSYSGAYVIWPDDQLMIDIFGFSEVSSPIITDEYPVIDDKGYLTFCSVLFRVKPGGGVENIQTLGFAFDATSQRKSGVYRQLVGREPGSPTKTDWYCATFLELFSELIDKRGRLA